MAKPNPNIFAILRAQANVPRGPVKPTLFGRPTLKAA